MKKWGLALFIAIFMMTNPVMAAQAQQQTSEAQEPISFADAMKLYLAGGNSKVDKKLVFALLTAHFEKDDTKINELSQKIRAGLKPGAQTFDKADIIGTTGSIVQEGTIENNVIVNVGGTSEPDVPNGETPEDPSTGNEDGKGAPTYIEWPEKVEYIGTYYTKASIEKKLPQTGMVSMDAVCYAATALLASGFVIGKKK